jgi:predicted DNA-binding transcriptional regulator YafY
MRGHNVEERPNRKHRVPSYGAAVRLARIVFELSSRPFGWAFDDIVRELNVSERTLLRYIRAAEKKLADRWGRPVFQVVIQGGRRKLRLWQSSSPVEPTAYQAASLYFMLTVLKCLEGTVLKDGVDGLWEKLHKNLSSGQQLKLTYLERKFYAVPYAPKHYKEFDEQIDLIVRALVQQRRLKIDYGGLLGKGSVHQFEPYTLVEYRGGLYLLGRTHLHRTPIFLALERIRSVELLVCAEGQPSSFVYPPTYRPDKHMEGTFGIMNGGETRVQLLIANDQTAAYLRARSIHPTQRFTSRPDGKTVLTMNVRGTDELTNWILGFGPWLEVLKPASLRARVGALLAEAAGRYAT